MRNIKVATLAAAPAVIAVAIVWLNPWRDRQAQVTVSVPAESAIVEKSSNAAAGAEHQATATPTTPPAELEILPVDPVAAAASSSGGTPEGPEQSRAQGPVVRRNSELDRRLDSEDVDPSWAPMVESLFDNMIPLAGLSFVRFETKCATTVCRSVIVHDFGYPAAMSLDDGSERPNYAGRYQAALLPLVEQGILQGASVQTGASPDSEFGNLESVIYLFRAEDQ